MCCYNTQHRAVFAKRRAVLTLTEGLIWCPENIFFILYNGCILLLSQCERDSYVYTHTYTCAHTPHVRESAPSYLTAIPRLLCPWGFSRQKYWSELTYSSSRGSSWPRDWTQVSLAGRFFTVRATRKALIFPVWYFLGQNVVSLSLTLWAKNVCPRWYLYHFACTFSNNYFYFFIILIIICKI